ncbi:MAG: HlyC/CorC family transporter, partial [Chloroflexi bacterium]|nr:HlyC/CorC family transporter [Chloroflexota bacterium]
RSAQSALSLVESPNRFLSTVQIGISLVGVLNGALGGATISEALAESLQDVPYIGPYSGGIALGLVVLVITYFSLVLGELIPKRLGLNHPERVASALAVPMSTLAWLTTPIVRFLSFSTDMGLRLLGVRKSDEPVVTEEEIKGLMEQGTREGVFVAAEQNIVQSVFRLADRRAYSIMTPRTETVWLDLDEPYEENLHRVLESRHSRFPVGQGSLDNVQGVVATKDFLAAAMRGPVDLAQVMEKPVFLPESMLALTALEEFRRKGFSLGVVIDEYGGILGILTAIDIFKSIVGELPNAGEAYEPLVVKRPDGSYLLDGLLQVDELKEILDIDELPGEERVGYQTLGGLMMAQLGDIPASGSKFEWNGLLFEVMDMDGRRVDKVLVSRQPESSADVI